MNSVGIFGYGRFGQILAQLLSEHYQVRVYDPNIDLSDDSTKIQLVSEEELLQEKNIFIAVPIRSFTSLIKKIANRLSNQTTLIDVCSIKQYPVEIMKKFLPDYAGIIATHPLFGPDSMDSSDVLNFMMYSVRDLHFCYEKWKHFFSQKFNIIEITPDEHDRLAAESQGVVHFVTRFLNEAKLHETSIDTVGFRQLLKLIENNCHDSWELFLDLQNYNPYSKAMLKRLEKAFRSVKSYL